MDSKKITKEILAKLMSTENIIVEHTDIPTAAFDLINRKLLLPNWKDISDDVYTLLISHEVGHALYTPKDEWEDAVKDSKDASLKNVINIVEDVRIEKLIQRKYPGVIRSFKNGYDELKKSNLFKTDGRDISSYSLLDRINLHFKLGHYGYMQIPFEDNEKPILKKVSQCKSFSDVLKVAKELKEFIEENPESQGSSQPQSNLSEIYENKDSDENTEATQEDGQQFNQNQEGKKLEPIQTNSENEDELGGSVDSNEPLDESNSNDEIKSETQSALDNNLKNMVDDAKTVYANIPNLNTDNFIVDYKVVHAEISNFYMDFYPEVYKNLLPMVDTFKSTTKSVVNQLANIFEMKKQAKLDVKSLVSKTGKLDTNKLYSYRYNEDIFKRSISVPEGKSHGLLMFIDMSSSMHNNMYGTYEQLLNLVLFCKRINIPFDVYGFTDYNPTPNWDKQKWNDYDLTIGDRFSLRHYFSNKMTGVEFNNALHNILTIMLAYKSDYRYTHGIPRQERLNTTPLLPSVLCAKDLVKKMREKYSLDIVNTIFLTDGEDNYGLYYKTEYKVLDDFCRRYYNSKTNLYVRDNQTKKVWKVDNDNPTRTMLNLVKETEGCKVIGFHIVNTRDVKYYLNANKIKDTEKHLSEYKKDKFSEILDINGYDAFYLIPSGNSLGVDDTEFTTEKNVNVDDKKETRKAIRSVAKEFEKHMSNKFVSRILLNRFIDHIC